MWLCVKRFLLAAALALQSLVVVVLWTRLFDSNASHPSWQVAMIRLSLPAVWIASIVLWQLAFGKRRWVGVTLTTIAACVLSASVAFCVDAFRPDVIYVPAKMAMGEGGWSHCIGNAEMTVNGKNITYRLVSALVALLSPILASDNDKKHCPYSGSCSGFVLAVWDRPPPLMQTQSSQTLTHYRD